MTIEPQALNALRDIFGDRLVVDAETVAQMSADSSLRSKKAIAAQTPLALADAVVRAQTTEDVQEAVRWAAANAVPVVARGGGSGVVGSGIPLRGGLIIDLSGLRQIGEVDVTNRLVTVGAGVIGSELEELLRPHGLGTGHYPQSFSLASVGGWIAMRGSGTFSSLYGNVEDRVADVEVVLADGSLLQTRSIPRASQGPDLKQLFHGSEGTLGVVTSVTLRLVPLPASRIFEAVHFPAFQPALDTARELLLAGVRPAVLRIYDPVESAAKHAQFAKESGWLMILAFDGDPVLTTAMQQIAVRIADEHGGKVLGPQPGVHWEQRRFDWSWFTDAVEEPGGIAEAIELATTWDGLERLYTEVVAAAGGVMDEVMGHVSHIYDQGASLYVISRGRFDDDAAAMHAYDLLWAAVMDVAREHGARISHHHGIGTERAAWLPDELGSGMQLLRTIKHAVDPADLMNPAKMGI